MNNQNRWNSLSMAKTFPHTCVLVLMALFTPQIYALNWRSETVDTYHVGKYSSIAIDSSGRIHISYYDSFTGNLKYALGAGSNWTVEVVAKAGSPNGASDFVYTSIAADPV